MANGFDKDVELHMLAWRGRHIDCNDCGEQNGKRRPWILPFSRWQEGLWPGIRGDAPWSLPIYLEQPGASIQKHVGAHNLKSSWTLCANLYFPFGHTPEGRSMLADFLSLRAGLPVTSVERVELEYAEEGDLHPSVLLGESGGKRGSGQTSPDVAFLVNGGTGIVLTESKFTEHSFYACSACRTTSTESKPGNPDPARCKDAAAVVNDPSSQCQQTAWGRRYWDHLVVDKERFATLTRCPAQSAGYQLLRQQALAEGMAKNHYQMVASCVAMDDRNDVLRRCLKRTGLADVTQWRELFAGQALFRVFSHQNWVAWVGEHGDPGAWGDWVEWVTERYGFGRSLGSPVVDA